MKKHTHRLSILFIVIGVLCLVIGAFFAANALGRYEHERGRFYDLAIYFSASGLVALLIRYFLILLPDRFKEKKSGVASRRRKLAKLYKRPAPTPQPDQHKKEGSILIMVLVLLGMVSSAALYAIVSARASEAETNQSLKSDLLRLAALDTARTAMNRLADDDMTVDHPGEDWAGLHDFTDPSGMERQYRIDDLQSGFDLNNLMVDRSAGNAIPVDEALANILVQCGDFHPDRKIKVLKDWVDRDHEGPFEADFYAAKDEPSRVSNRMLYGWEELLHVDGWNPDMLERSELSSQKKMFGANVADCISIIPVSRTQPIPVNINTVDPSVLRALLGFASEGPVSRIIVQRKEQPFRSLSSLSALIGEQAFDRMKPYIDVKSRFFHIVAKAYAGGKSASIHMVASRDEDGQVRAVRTFF